MTKSPPRQLEAACYSHYACKLNYLLICKRDIITLLGFKYFLTNQIYNVHTGCFFFLAVRVTAMFTSG